MKAVFGDQNDKFAFLAGLGDALADFSGGAGQDGFVSFGEFPAYTNAALGSERVDQVVEAFADAVAGFLDEDGVVTALL